MEYIVLAGVCLLTFGLIGFAVYLLYLEYCGTDIYRVLEDKIPHEHMSHAEKKSRERVGNIVRSGKSPMQKCIELDKEMSDIRTQITVSRQWKNIVELFFNDIMKKNKMTLQSNHRGSTVIYDTTTQHASTCLLTR